MFRVVLAPCAEKPLCPSVPIKHRLLPYTPWGSATRAVAFMERFTDASARVATCVHGNTHREVDKHTMQSAQYRRRCSHLRSVHALVTHRHHQVLTADDDAEVTTLT